ncbi:MAG TPA: hypothetical protein VLM75_02720 [Spirochaetota bacterium]|nr:hypothetical protein [Spirochaetota bacterium]
MTQRKKYVLDKKFQFKTAFSIIAVILLVSAVIVAAISANISMNNRRLNNIIVLYNNNVEALLAFSQEAAGAENLPIANISGIHAQNVATMEKIIAQNNALLRGIVVFILAQGAILFIALIRKTHHISGPIYVMSGYMKEIIAGKYPSPRPLRKNDEFKEFYALFGEMVERLKERR